MNTENRPGEFEVDLDRRRSLIDYHREASADEIDLGELIRNLFGEWRIIALVIAIGAILAIASAVHLSKVYAVEGMLRAPYLHELGDIRRQNIIAVEPSDLLMRVVDNLLAPEIQQRVLERSRLGKNMLENSEVSHAQLIHGFRKDFSVNVVKHDFYQLEKGEKSPFKEVNIAMKSDQPVLAAEFVQLLIEQAQAKALVDFSNDVAAIKVARIRNIEEQIAAMSLAAEQSRQAEITRLQESNNESIDRLQQQVDLKIRKTKQDRENNIIRLSEALKTAKGLGISDPVSWDDLRPERKSTQIINELNGEGDFAPLYFRGTRLLQAELDRLASRADDKPFIDGLTDLENQVLQLRYDPRIEALKARANDTIYIDRYDDMQRDLKSLLNQPENFSNVQLAVISEPATVLSGPTRNPLIIFVLGLIISGFLALVIACVRLAMRNSKHREQSLTSST